MGSGDLPSASRHQRVTHRSVIEIFLLSDTYGPLEEVISGASFAMAAAVALFTAWRGRSDWEPAKSDLPDLPAKVGVLVSAVLITVLFVGTIEASDNTLIMVATLLGVAVVVVASVAYLSLIGIFVCVRQHYRDDSELDEERIIAGFVLTPEARRAKREGHLTTQNLLAGMGYEPDAVWAPWSRIITKLAFVVAYLLLTVAGTIALAGAGILLSRVV